jgi:hypothetical protein
MSFCRLCGDVCETFYCARLGYSVCAVCYAEYCEEKETKT